MFVRNVLGFVFIAVLYYLSLYMFICLYVYLVYMFIELKLVSTKDM